MSHPHDTLPQSPAVSALVRRISMKLSGALAFNGHPTLSQVEVAGFFDMGEASKQLDRIAVLPGMAQHEERARRDLLDLFYVFHPEDVLEATVEVPLPVLRSQVEANVIQRVRDAMFPATKPGACKCNGTGRILIDNVAVGGTEIDKWEPCGCVTP